MSRSVYKFQLFKRATLRGKRWFFRYVAPNNEVMFQSQAYKDLDAARESIAVIRAMARNSIVEVVDA